VPVAGGPVSDEVPGDASDRAVDQPPDQAVAQGPGGELPGAVLFVCSMNAVRSPMAAAILRHLAGRQCYVVSAGVRAGGSDPFATAVMDEIGIDIADHKPHTLQDLHDTSFDLIVTLSPEAHHQALELTRTMAVDVEFWPTYDATVMLGHGSREQILDMYRTVRDQLFRRIKARFGFAGGPSV
jgi:protein-tyrosine-phosphatase